MLAHLWSRTAEDPRFRIATPRPVPLRRLRDSQLAEAPVRPRRVGRIIFVNTLSARFLYRQHLESRGSAELLLDDAFALFQRFGNRRPVDLSQGIHRGLF